MKIEHFPRDIRSYLMPEPSGEVIYRCLGCSHEFGIDELLYTCPDCGQVLLLRDRKSDRLKRLSGELWHRIFDYRKMLTAPALKGIYRFHEFIGPVIPLRHIVYLGEGNTPLVEASPLLQQRVGRRFFFKNDGQNPSASFKDRGMASAFSYLNFLLSSGRLENVLAICASTGDTSAAAALYAAYLKPGIKSAVLLPQGKVTPQQLGQPLGSGAQVFEMPGVFDDCMKVVEYLSEHYNVALLNSKNAWRILGQESYSYEIAQDFEYEVGDKVVVVPIGNAGNITAVMSGFLKFLETGIIQRLPKIIGVQSDHANPVYRYYSRPKPERGRFEPVSVRPSVAQAAMIGNPVSIPRVIHLVKLYDQVAGEQRVFFASVPEQDIMDWELEANRHGHVACTHGGECLAGLIAAIRSGWIEPNETAILDSTAHALKFSGFQDMYFENRFPDAYAVTPNPELINRPHRIDCTRCGEGPESITELEGGDGAFFSGIAEEIAKSLGLTSRR
ncbi:MAG: threonine synthase [Desulfobacterales bacterium]